MGPAARARAPYRVLSLWTYQIGRTGTDGSRPDVRVQVPIRVDVGVGAALSAYGALGVGTVFRDDLAPDIDETVAK